MASTSVDSWRQHIDSAVDAHFDAIVDVRRHLHAQPERSGEEVATTRYLSDQVRRAGFEARPAPSGRGLIVDPATCSDQPRIALRADIDALNVQDAKDVPYRSRVAGIMHACGHDGHAATVLGAIWALGSAAQAGDLPWPVPWRAIFQPAEETNRGAFEMIEAGALDKVAAMLTVHVDPSRRVGTIAIRPGPFTADCVEMEIQIYGRGGHAARPHEALDPISTAAQLITSTYLSVPRLTDSHDPVVVSFGQIAGGQTPNAIPDHVLLRGTLRSFRPETRTATIEHIRQLAKGLAVASGTRIELQFNEGPPAVYNDPGLTELIRLSAADLLGETHVHGIDNPSMGGEDFANYLEQVPGSMFRLGCATAADAPPLHSPDFDIDEKALAIGAKVLARAAVLWADPGERG